MKPRCRGGDPTSPTVQSTSQNYCIPYLSPSHLDCMVNYLTVDCMCRRTKFKITGCVASPAVYQDSPTHAVNHQVINHAIKV